MFVGPHVDKPGIIGRVGTILGEKGINIAEHARRSKDGRQAGDNGDECGLGYSG